MTKQRKNFRSGGSWETQVGYSRAVRVGNWIAVSGCTAAAPDGAIIGVGDAYAQASRCIEVIESALQQANAGLADVIRTRLYVTNIDQWPDIARAHAEAFGAIGPAATMVEVSRLIHPDMLVEIEADAVVSDS